MSEAKKFPIEDYTTLTGKPLMEAFATLNAELPAGAYKAMTGGKGAKIMTDSGKGLTDIQPAYLPELLLEVFGPLGLGWGFEITEMETTADKVERKKGTPDSYFETEYASRCKIAVWFAYDDGGEELRQSNTFPATGGNVNTQPEWSEKGALTYALGSAWFFAGYQLDVYKGLRSHRNVGNGTKPQLVPDKPPKKDEDEAKRTNLIKKLYAVAGKATKANEILKEDEAELKDMLRVLSKYAFKGKTISKLSIEELGRMVTGFEEDKVEKTCQIIIDELNAEYVRKGKGA